MGVELLVSHGQSRTQLIFDAVLRVSCDFDGLDDAINDGPSVSSVVGANARGGGDDFSLNARLGGSASRLSSINSVSGSPLVTGIDSPEAAERDTKGPERRVSALHVLE